jgi:hypothetical protein
MHFRSVSEDVGGAHKTSKYRALLDLWAYETRRRLNQSIHKHPALRLDLQLHSFSRRPPSLTSTIQPTPNVGDSYFSLSCRQVKRALYTPNTLFRLLYVLFKSLTLAIMISTTHSANETMTALPYVPITIGHHNYSYYNLTHGHLNITDPWTQVIFTSLY